jgi:hypothetical protein
MNNSMMQLLSMVRQGGNPMQLIQQMAANNPQAAQAMRIMQGKNPEQLKQIATNMARERGMSVEQVMQQLGIR